MVMLGLSGWQSMRGEAMVQYFNTEWAEITAKMPELAEAGYDSIWLPPPTKGSGGLSVGYDLWDRFDLGSKDQRGSVKTRYGTEAELLRLVETAHRFGLRVYFDNIMNHNAFDVPGYNADTPVDLYPGFVPEDFHLRLQEDGTYRKWDNTRNWGDAWQVMNLGLADLIDIAQEPGTTNLNFGGSEGSTFPKIKFVRNPNQPEYYCFRPDGTYVGFGNVTQQMLDENPEFYAEYVQDYLNRTARWMIDRTKCDGFRLDAVKHVRPDFFGATYGPDKDASSYGYLGQAQDQFNRTRGFSDWDNHRDTVFDTEKPRDDALMFGEHLGEPPGYSDYFNAGMRLVDNPLRNNLNERLGSPWNGLNGYDSPGAGGFAPNLTVMHAQSHDNDYAARRELQHAFYFTRAGIGLIYTDGNHHAETLGESGGAFPRHANTAFLGQWNDNRIPNLLYIHQQFGRGYQVGRWSDSDFVAYERIDKRENTSMSDADGVTMLVMLNDNYASGQARSFTTSFPAVPFVSDAYLYNYSSYGGGFYTYASNLKNIVVPPGGYFVFGWRNPEESDLWTGNGGKPVTIVQNGTAVGTVTVTRRDGPDGDPAFNPYGVADADTTDFAYNYAVPRVTGTTPLTVYVRADASAENILLKLDGGIDLNGTRPATTNVGTPNTDPGYRDNPPALSWDMFLGYEQAEFVARQYGEKFAAVDSARNKFGSAGAETWSTTIGSGVVTTGTCTASNDFSTDGGNHVAFFYHDPAANTPVASGTNQYQETAGSIVVHGKTNAGLEGYRAFIYYTTDGSYPEGAGGMPIGTTQVAEMGFVADEGGGSWWRGEISPKPTGLLRYKLGAFRQTAGGFPVASVFPSGATEVTRKKRGMTTFRIENFNPIAATFYPHNDYGVTQTGLSEGFHVLRGRAFLKRDGSGVGNGRRASIYNTFTQTFYYDVLTPGGEIRFPASGETIGSQQYGVVVRADPSVTEVWYHIDDSDPANDDSALATRNGNGSGPEPFSDTNRNGTRDAGEPFTDLNGNGVFDALLSAAWARATEVTPSVAISSVYPREFRFDYVNIPPGNTPATIKVRLLEIGSSRNMTLAGAAPGSPRNTAGDAVTELTQNVTTNGPTTRMFIAWPQANGDTIGTNYKVKIYFSKSLADSFDLGNPAQRDAFLERFLITIASSESGSAAHGVVQDRANYQINQNVSADYHELQYPRDGVDLPNLYNGVPDFLHTITVTHTRPSAPVLTDMRQVKFAPGPISPFVSIVTPPEFDSDGRRFEIILPDVAAPSPEQRQYPIQVETDAEADHVAIAFVSGTGSASLLASGTTPLRGTVSVTNGSPVVTGAPVALSGTFAVTTGTNRILRSGGPGFTAELAHGDTISLSGTTAVVEAVTDSEIILSGTWSGTTQSGLSASVLPSYLTALSAGNIVQIGGVNYTVATVDASTQFTLAIPYGGATASGIPASRIDPNPVTIGTHKFWNFLWENMTEGTFTFRADVDTDGNPATIEASATRNARVIFRQRVPANESDSDDDDDALPDLNETTATPLPETNAETWTNGQVHVFYAFGRSDPLSPDTDGDLLPDGLEVGWRNPTATGPTATDPNADTNGDGIKNYVGDLDPPFYNTLGNDYATAPTSNYGRVPGVTSASEGGDRAKQVAGSTTNPANPDTDGDGLRDGIEDANRNGWVDGDGAALPLNFDPWLGRNWPNGKMDPGETWTETDPNNPDTDADGLSDGWGEDTNLNGTVDPGETNSLDPDSDDDGLPDGWETAHGLNPLDATGYNGANGDPDGDTFSNAQELVNGTDPNTFDSGAPPPPGGITIGPVPEDQKVVVGGVTNYKEFTDWTADDLIALDEYEGGGTNNQGGDIYPAWDGFDSSRDIVAFYARDGGDPGAGGDGNFYFRVDFHDLKALAEQANLDVYVVIDTNSPGTGERKLPDDVDTLTNMRWEAVIACYSTNQGRVYVDTNRAVEHNSTSLLDDLNSATLGIVGRDQNTPNGFRKAYFNSELDAVEFSISRQALRDAGWNGLNASDLNFQVFTTRDGTRNTPAPGPGDIGGRSDIRDSIYDDWIAEDYYNAQSGIAGDKSVLGGWFGLSGANDRGRRVKVVSLLHGNQPILPGSSIQALINSGTGTGYYRPLDVHQAYAAPLAVHLTPTLASAIQWAKVSGTAPAYYDGPSFNARIAALAASGSNQIVELIGSTFSDHILPYFSTALNADNTALAHEFLTHFYGADAISSNVFWTPERVVDHGVLAKVADLGYQYTFVDQMRHVFKWFGRTSALGNEGYRIQQINGVKCFVLSDQAGSYRFQNTDEGVAWQLRELFNRKARSFIQDQVVVLFSDLNDFLNGTNAAAYDKNVRWMASRPWIQIVTPQKIARGDVPYLGQDGSVHHTWGTTNRGTGLTLAKVQHDWLDHATQEDYDHWYFGQSGREESLAAKVFNIRTGVPLPAPFGILDNPSPSGIVASAWNEVAGMGGGVLARLARATAHAALFETAFHEQSNHDLTKFSTGAYVYPDTDANKPLAGFAKIAQAQFRFAAMYRKVQLWADAAVAGDYLHTATAQATDVDLDGENEFVLFNDRVYAVFERSGGRLVAAWARDIENADVVQIIGNQPGYAGSETEEEGATNVAGGSVNAHRTSGFKDWWAAGPNTNTYVNDYYSAVAASGTTGWVFTSSDGKIVKTITLAPRSTLLKAGYALSGGITTLYVRFGFSPNLYDLLLNGQANLSEVGSSATGEFSILNSGTNGKTRALLRFGSAQGYSAALNESATDRDGGVSFHTINMRNQAHTRQIEVSGANGMTFALGLQAGSTISLDSDQDGVPDWWTDEQFGHPTGQAGDLSRADDDADNDGLTTVEEFILGSNPHVRDFGIPRSALNTDGLGNPVLSFPTQQGRLYTIYYRNSLVSGAWVEAGDPIPGTGTTMYWTDDGSRTTPPPSAVPTRFYKVGVVRPLE